MADARRNTPIDSKSAGRQNEIMVMSMLRKHGRLSQTELCRLAKIGSSTVSTIVARLRDKGFIIETRGASDRRGPKPLLLELNPKSLYVIAIEINPSYLYFGIFSFVGEVRDKRRIALHLDHSVENVIKLIRENVNELIKCHGLAREQILGVGVSLSGSVSADGSISLSSPMGWKDVALKKMLSLQLGFAVLIYSNRVRLLAEFEIQPELASKNILYLNLANGVGSTVYVDRRLMFGATGRYGEIGHIIIDPQGPRCGCGNMGCLESFISGPALASRIEQDYCCGRAELFKCMFKNEKKSAPEEVIMFLAEAVDKHDSYAVKLRNEIAERFSKIAAMLINCYDPETVILAGYIARLFGNVLIESIRDKMRTDVYDSTLRKIDIILARAGEDAVIKGVGAAVLQDSLSMTW